MKVLVIEDEPVNARELVDLIQSIDAEIEIVKVLDTIAASVQEIMRSEPDLIFMDIELGDGSAFEIFDQVEVTCPIIFTTAYDEYALKAFELNSIAYLLKPVTEEKLTDALQKLKKLEYAALKSSEYKLLFNPTQKFKENFLVKFGTSLIPVETNAVFYFLSDENQVYLVDRNHKKYLTSYSLTHLEEILNPQTFFRINRQYIVHRQSVASLKPHLKGQVSVSIHSANQLEVVASRLKTAQIKEWLQ